MRIFGIYIREMDKMLQKNLQVGWFPFGDYPKPAENSYVQLDVYTENQRRLLNEELYALHSPDAPNISITCIAGKNGSGKSTLLDIMFRIINNLADHFLLNDDYVTLKHAFGVNADLHFEVDGIPGMIKCGNTTVDYFWGYDEEQHPKRISDKGDECYNQLSNFFYTISINYSLYAYNCKDYYPRDSKISKFSKGINGDWIKSIFNKNDGYLTPLELAPFRDDNGNIDVNTENKLSHQRLISLILLFHFQGKQFIPGYEPIYIYWQFDSNYLSRAKNKLFENSVLSENDFKNATKMFSKVWSMYFDSIGLDFSSIYVFGNRNPKNYCLNYLAYKSLKICLTYPEYKKLYDENEDSPEKLLKIVEIMTETIDHITVKIHQCLNFIKSEKYHNASSHTTVNSIVDDCQSIRSFDDMMMVLPPSFFHVNIEMGRKRSEHNEVNVLPSLLPFRFVNQDTFFLEDMSSGERQFLYSISYALYHIKNLERIENGYHRVHYKNINLVLDEVELYYHPEYQRKYIQMLLESLRWCGFSSSNISSINIILVTHSPFILSDMTHNNVLYIDDGKPRKVDGKTFGANYYDLLYNSFFFDKNAIGEVATRVISDMIRTPESYKDHKYLYDIIGDPLIRGYLLNRIDKNVQD